MEKPTIIKIYATNGIQLVKYELNNHINTMPIDIFKKKYKIKNIFAYSIGGL